MTRNTQAQTKAFSSRKRPSLPSAAALALSAAVLALLSGCASQAPQAEAPPAPIAAAWPVAGAASANSGTSTSTSTSAGATANASAPSAALAWPEFVRDARLRELLSLSLANNRDLRVALLTVEQARATYRIQDAAQLPTLNASAGLNASRTPAQASSSGKEVLSRTYSVGLGLAAYELDFFGRVKSLTESALQSYLSTEAAQRSTQLSLVGDVITAWLTLAADQQQLALARQTLQSQQATYALTERRKALGAVSGLTLVQAQTTVEAARASVASYESQVERDRNALALLVGSAVPASLLPDMPSAASSLQRWCTGQCAPLSPTPLPQGERGFEGMSPSPLVGEGRGEGASPTTALVSVPAGLPSEVLQRRPDVLAAQALLQAAQADTRAARAALFPRISLTASAGTASRELGELFQGGAWSFAPSITLPILDGGAAQTTLRKAEITRDIRLASYDKAVQTAFREVADALSVRAWLAERLAAQQALVNAYQQSLTLADARFKAGADTYLNVLDAQRSLYSAQQNLISLQLTEQSNRVTLYKVLGGA